MVLQTHIASRLCGGLRQNVSLRRTYLRRRSVTSLKFTSAPTWIQGQADLGSVQTTRRLQHRHIVVKSAQLLRQHQCRGDLIAVVAGRRLLIGGQRRLEQMRPSHAADQEHQLNAPPFAKTEAPVVVLRQLRPAGYTRWVRAVFDG